MNGNIFLVFPTMRCNLRCPYCHFGWKNKEGGGYNWDGYGIDHEINKELDAQELLDALDKFQPYHVEFSGGEPTLWRGFADFVNGMPKLSRWAITSNTLLPKIRTLNLSKCVNWTASYHETDLIKFIDNCISIRDRAPHVAISQVVTKANVDECLQKADLFASLGFMPNLLRELNPGVSWEGSPEWEKLVAARAKGYNVVEDDIPPSYTFEKGFLCDGGHSYFSIMPDGQAYKCYSEAMHGNALGHIRDLKPTDGPRDCFAECLGCALDHRARLKKLEANDAHA